MEYEDLIQQKRLARTNKTQTVSETPAQGSLLDFMPVSQGTEEQVSKEEKESVPQPITKKRENIESLPDTLPEEPPSKPKPVTVKKAPPVLVSQEEEEEETEELEDVDVVALGEMLGEDLEDSDEDWDDEEDDEDEDDEDYDESLSSEGDIQVLPLSAATFPKTCYLVIDRSAELIARPLKEFAHLGQIPMDEVQQRTLPIFDNHRVARRFSNRSQRSD